MAALVNKAINLGLHKKVYLSDYQFLKAISAP
jgi:hypothetical protein